MFNVYRFSQYTIPLCGIQNNQQKKKKKERKKKFIYIDFTYIDLIRYARRRRLRSLYKFYVQRGANIIVQNTAEFPKPEVREMM